MKQGVQRQYIAHWTIPALLKMWLVWDELGVALYRGNCNCVDPEGCIQLIREHRQNVDEDGGVDMVSRRGTQCGNGVASCPNEVCGVSGGTKAKRGKHK